MRFLPNEERFFNALRYFSGAAHDRRVYVLYPYNARARNDIRIRVRLVSNCVPLSPRSSHWGVCNRVGEPKRGVLERSWCTVVFHSHYRNVLPCALVAPRNKSSVTVSMGGAQGGYRCWRGVQGVIVAARTPRPTPRANLCDGRCVLVTVVTSFSSLSPVLTWESSPGYMNVSRRCSTRAKIRR